MVLSRHQWARTAPVSLAGSTCGSSLWMDVSPEQEDREQGDLIWLLSSCATSEQPLRAALAGAGAGEALGIGFRLLNLVEKLEVWLAPANQVWAGPGNMCCLFFAGIQERHVIRRLF